MATQFLPPQKSQRCPHPRCRAVNWLPIPPDPAAPISAQVAFNCWRCGQTFLHTVGGGPTLFLVRCRSAMNALPPLVAVAWVCAALYGCWLLAHRFGIPALAALLVLGGVCLSLRHEGLKSLPAAAALFGGMVMMARLTLAAVPWLVRFGLSLPVPSPADVQAISLLVVLVVAGCVWFGAPSAPYFPEPFYDGSLLHGGAGLDGIDNPEALEDADF